MYAWVYAWLCVRMYILVCVCVFVYMYSGVYMWLYVLVICYNDADLFMRFKPSNRDLDPTWIYVHYGLDTLTIADQPMDDPQIHIDSCSKDQIVIQFQNRIILCECLFIDCLDTYIA